VLMLFFVVGLKVDFFMSKNRAYSWPGYLNHIKHN
jgi:hypothetical protein